jgi:hypothetical protein
MVPFPSSSALKSILHCEVLRVLSGPSVLMYGVLGLTTPLIWHRACGAEAIQNNAQSVIKRR